MVARRAGSDQYDLYVAAVMTAKSGTLVSNMHSYIYAIGEQKQNLEAVPERFRPLVEAFDIHRGRVLDESRDADAIDSSLYYQVHGILVSKLGRHEGRITSRLYVLEGARSVFWAVHPVTGEESEWLWSLAQAMHDEEVGPVERWIATDPEKMEQALRLIKVRGTQAGVIICRDWWAVNEDNLILDAVDEALGIS